ncbi:hypothetical protein MJA45_18645 [Paenibacillus aurantius]|uniref:Uncharacterized protein n=1 Tax=Paenibacillus aurantius TaxID=2918900 RepID=A0AA96LAM8_9BACL|nr:hypothetical protein [Paenibacillus aurantius]WNQ09638.1 hypothetical protein MJA45_18645 [Paenibacillus aurantius]
MLLTIVLLSGCRGIGGQAIIDWADFLKLNGISYSHYWYAALTDPAKIGGKVGEVAFQVADNVHNPGYKTKNGDAAFLAKGTVVYAVEGYSDHSVVAVKDPKAFNGYRLYANDQKIQELSASLEPVEQTVKRAIIYKESSDDKPIVDVQGVSASFFVSLLKRSEDRESYTPSRTNGDPKMYRFVIDTGKSIGYSNIVLDDGVSFYWQDRNTKLLPSEFAYYFAEPRRPVFRVGDIEFTLPRSSLTLATGEQIKQDGSTNNITVLSRDGKTERYVFPAEAYDNLLKRVQLENPGSGESKTILYWASRPTPVNDGRAIAFESNKNAVLTKKQTFSIHLVNADGTGEKVLVDGAKYGYAVLLDSLGSRLVAESEDRSVLDIDVVTGAIRKHEVNSHLEALSKDGRYVLYRGMDSDVLVGRKLWVIDLETGQKTAAGDVPQDYIYNKGIK